MNKGSRQWRKEVGGVEPQTAEWIAYKAKKRADLSMYFALAGLFIAPVLAPLIGLFFGA